MKKINEIFFAKEGEKGITSSSANYLANIATELLESFNNNIRNISFIDKNVSVVGSDSKLLASKGITLDKFENIPVAIDEAAKLYAFVAYIREAIKAKEDEISTAKKYSFNQWLIDNDITLEEYPEQPIRPIIPEQVTQDDVLENWSIAERNLYWQYEAVASTYGKLIHKDGAINIARDNMKQMLANPVTTLGSGRDTTVYYYSESVPEENVEKTFLELQNTYRIAEKSLNSLKYRIKEEMNALTLEREVEYKASLDEYKKNLFEFNKKVEEIDNNKAELQGKYREYLTELVNKTSKLKIVIPNALTGIFNKLDSVGK